MSDSVLSAVIGASIALIGLIIAKDGKVSEFRQQWIDALRDDVAILISNAIHYSENALNAKAANEAIARIRLRLNPREKQSKALLKSMQALNVAVHGDLANVKQVSDGVVGAAHEVLSLEWKRVKRGELKYRIILYLALVALCFSGGKLLYPDVQHVWQRLFKQESPTASVPPASSPQMYPSPARRAGPASPSPMMHSSSPSS
jgi:hypothetical protein